MKTAIPFYFLFSLVVFSACIQPVPGAKVKISVKLSAPPPVDSVPMQFGPDAELKDLKFLVGDTVATKGIVYGHKDSGDTTFVYLGAAYPNQPLTVVLTGNAKTAFGNMDKKLIYVAGCISEHKGKIQMIVSDTDHIGIKYLYRKRKAK